MSTRVARPRIGVAETHAPRQASYRENVKTEGRISRGGELRMPQVSIIGAGIAGLAAAFRLLQRGFDVSLLEQNSFLGGKLGAHQSHK
jgi:NADPH-dependent 2,4-dienoyl-CoA reductase/sulfur reductase-like enzyme